MRALIWVVVVGACGTPARPPPSNTSTTSGQVVVDGTATLAIEMTADPTEPGLGVVVGSIKNACDEPVPIATVIIGSPALKVEQIAVSDARGTFRLDKLPAGSYELELFHERGAKFVHRPIAVAIERTTKLTISHWDVTSPHNPLDHEPVLVDSCGRPKL
jgi:hypothetical protein